MNVPLTIPPPSAPTRAPIRTRTRSIAVVQSCYIPWKGYFDMIRRVDEFILYDDAQYTRRDWRNRNRIKTAQGTKWLTIPVEAKGRFTQPIREVVVSDPDWNRRHWETVRHAYGKAPFFGAYREALEDLWLGCRERHLSLINRRFLLFFCGVLGIDTDITASSDYRRMGGRNGKLIGYCRQTGANRYLSGPSAREYMDRRMFRDAGVEIEFMNYDGYPEYPQIHPPFEHRVSILDLVLHTGPEAPRYLERTP